MVLGEAGCCPARRLSRCQIAGRRPTLGVDGEPCPSRILTAHPAAAKIRQARLTVCSLHPTRAAISALVTATLRPVASSANCAITTATAINVAVVIDNGLPLASPSLARTASKSPDAAHARTPSTHPVRETHTGIAGAVASPPTRSTHARRSADTRARCSRSDTAARHNTAGTPGNGPAPGR